MSFEMTSDEFFLQLGPDYKQYTAVLIRNGFTDVDTICTMQIKEDMDTMFKEDSLPLGHRRKIEAAILNLQKAVEPGTAIINKSLEADESQTEAADDIDFCNEIILTPGIENEKGSMVKIKELQTQKLTELTKQFEKEKATQ